MNITLIRILALVYIVITVIVYGKILDCLAFSKTIDHLGNFLMRFFRTSKYKLKVICCWFIYLGTGLLFALGACILFRDYFSIPVFKFSIHDIPILLLGFISQSSLSCLALLLIKAVVPSLHWEKIIGDVEWVKASKRFPAVVRIIYPMSSSCVEEYLFRGVLYYLLRNIFEGTHNIIIPIIIIAVAFSIEQILNTQTIAQAVGLMIGSLCISIIGCLMIEVTGSITPAVVTHMMFAVFYTKGYDM